jgi:peptide/nickel transport system substrate-binding protein
MRRKEHLLREVTGGCRGLRTRPHTFALFVLAAAACVPTGDREDTTGNTVTVAYYERGMYPDEDMPAKFLTFLSLTTLDEKGELEDRLARRWEHSHDYREWTYHLRTDVRWHDGVPVTAYDIAFSVDLWQRVSHYYTSFIESATVVDDSTVTLRYTSSADESIMSYITYYPKHILSALDPDEFYQWDFWTHPVGNGPYRFVRHIPQTMMEFTANSDFFRGMPKIQRVVLKFAQEAGLAELLSGNVDAVTWTNPADISKIATDPRFRVYFSPESYRGYAIYWQNDHPLFEEPTVRRALTMAIDRRELLRALNLPDDIPVVDGPFTERQLRRGELPEALPFDTVLANELLNAAGWLDRDGDGVRQRHGTMFRFTALVASQGEGSEETAILLQEHLRRIGVRMDLQPLDQGNVRERIRTGAFEAAFGWFGNDPGSLGAIGLGGGAPLGYARAEVVELIERAAGTADPEARDRVYRRLAEILQADVPITFLGPRVNVVFAHRRLQGLRSPWRVDPVWHMEELWLGDGK